MHILVPIAPFFMIQRERNLDVCSLKPCSKFQKIIPGIDDGLAHTLTIYGVSYHSISSQNYAFLQKLISWPHKVILENLRCCCINNFIMCPLELYLLVFTFLCTMFCVPLCPTCVTDVLIARWLRATHSPVCAQLSFLYKSQIPAVLT